MEAVIGEPVSVWLFHVSRENTGKFWRLDPLAATMWPRVVNKFNTFSPNSLRKGTGNFADGTANLKRLYSEKRRLLGRHLRSESGPHRPGYDVHPRVQPEDRFCRVHREDKQDDDDHRADQEIRPKDIQALRAKLSQSLAKVVCSLA